MSLVWSQRLCRRLLSVTVALLVTACGGGTGTEATPPPGPGVVESTEDRLPEGFPDDVWLPDEHTVVYSATTEASVAAQFTSPLSDEELRQLFIDQLAVHGWVLVSCDDTEVQGYPATFIVATKDDREAQVQIGFIPHRAEHLEEFQFAVNIRPAREAEQRPSDC